MICILSTSEADPSTEDVIEWLNAWNVPWVRLNAQSLSGEDPITVSMSNTTCETSIHSGNNIIDCKEIGVVWYRRWSAGRGRWQYSLFAEDLEAAKRANVFGLARHLDNEVEVLSGVLFQSFSSARWFSHPDFARPNKLNALNMAASCGLDIPATLVTTDRGRMCQFIRARRRVITKPLSDLFTYDWHDGPYASYTTEVTESDVAVLPSFGFPMLLQELLAKSYDIRLFYLDRVFYGMAIFSQSRNQTSVDFRRYTYERPVRTVPYKVPGELATGLQRLMDALHLETGSLDLVKTIDGRLVFLEVNPVGQFGMVSIPCNYHLERNIAAALTTRLGNRQ